MDRLVTIDCSTRVMLCHKCELVLKQRISATPWTNSESQLSKSQTNFQKIKPTFKLSNQLSNHEWPTMSPLLPRPVLLLSSSYITRTKTATTTSTKQPGGVCRHYVVTFTTPGRICTHMKAAASVSVAMTSIPVLNLMLANME